MAHRKEKPDPWHWGQGMEGWWGAQEGFLDKVEFESGFRDCGMLQSGGGAVTIAEKLQKQKPVPNLRARDDF